MRTLDIVVTVFLIIGALNWGLMGFFGFNLVGAIFGGLERLIYALVGVSGLYELYNVTIGRTAMQHRWCAIPAPRHVPIRH